MVHLCVISPRHSHGNSTHTHFYAYTHPRTHTHTHAQAHFWHGLIDVKKPHPPSLLQCLPFFTKQCQLFGSSAALGAGLNSDPDPAELPPIIRVKVSDYKVKVQPLSHTSFLTFSELKRGILLHVIYDFSSALCHFKISGRDKLQSTQPWRLSIIKVAKLIISHHLLTSCVTKHIWLSFFLSLVMLLALKLNTPPF